MPCCLTACRSSPPSTTCACSIWCRPSAPAASPSPPPRCPSTAVRSIRGCACTCPRTAPTWHARTSAQGSDEVSHLRPPTHTPPCRVQPRPRRAAGRVHRGRLPCLHHVWRLQCSRHYRIRFRRHPAARDPGNPGRASEAGDVQGGVAVLRRHFVDLPHDHHRRLLGAWRSTPAAAALPCAVAAAGCRASKKLWRT